MVRWLAEQNLCSLHLSAMTVFEIELGAARLERRDPDQGSDLRRWVDDVVGFGVPLLNPWESSG